MTKIVSIDIGYLNMAIVCVETDFKDLFVVNNVYKINLSRFSNATFLSEISFLKFLCFLFKSDMIFLCLPLSF